jgi:hypothetical protein
MVSKMKTLLVGLVGLLVGVLLVALGGCDEAPDGCEAYYARCLDAELYEICTLGRWQVRSCVDVCASHGGQREPCAIDESGGLQVDCGCLF